MQGWSSSKGAGEYQCRHCDSTGSYYWDAQGAHSQCRTCELKKKVFSVYLQQKVTTVTPDQLYSMGYEDGKSGKAANASYVHEENYQMGYEDGKGDRATRPVEEGYVELNDPPAGFVFTDEKRVPLPGEWYLSKNGNPVQAKKVRLNNQTRHILIPD
jgi:hypothetical protein